MIYQKQFTFVFIREDASILKKKKMRVYLASALLSVCSHGYVLIKGTWRPQVTFDGYYLSN